MKGIITVRYRTETGLTPYKFNWLNKRIGYTDEYVNWLEKQCVLSDVVIS